MKVIVGTSSPSRRARSRVEALTPGQRAKIAGARDGLTTIVDDRKLSFNDQLRMLCTASTDLRDVIREVADAAASHAKSGASAARLNIAAVYAARAAERVSRARQ